MHSTFDFLSRTTRHLLLLALLFSCAALGGGVDSTSPGSNRDNFTTQLDLVSSDHAALIGQQDILRAAKRFDHDDSSDAPWLLTAADLFNLPSYAVPLPVRFAVPARSAVSNRSHTPRAPPAIS